MPSKFVQVMVCRSDSSPRDKKLSQGLAPRLNLLTQQGVVVGGSDFVMPGENRQEKTFQAVFTSQIAILLMSIEWLLDPTMQILEPLLLERTNSGNLHLFPILLRPFPYSLSAFAHIVPVNSKFVGKMILIERERTWEFVLAQIRDTLGLQLLPPSLHCMLTEQYLRDLSVTFTKHTNMKVSLFMGTGAGTLNHGLAMKPDKVLLASQFGQGMVPTHVLSTTVQVPSAMGGHFTGLAIANKA